MPRLRWKSSKRRTPRKASRITSSDQRSPTTSSALATEQTCVSYWRPSTTVILATRVASGNSPGNVRFVKKLERRWQVLAVVSAAVFMSSLDLFIVNIAFPDIQRDFGGASLASLSWILNAYAIVFAALLVPAGRSADRLGRRRSFLAGLAIFTVASALCAVAPSVPALVAARVLQAIGAAAVFPTSLALVLPEFPPSERRTAVAVWAAVGGVAAAAGPPVGGLLVQAGWQLVFLVNVPIGVVLVVVAARV